MKKIISLSLVSLGLILFHGCSSSSKNTSDSSDPEVVSEESDSSQASDDLQDPADSEQAVSTDQQKSDDLLTDNSTAKPEEFAPAESTSQVVETPPPAIESPRAAPVEIKAVRFEPNETGGAFVIEASGPLTYTTRKNSSDNQYIVEVTNATLPERLKRPFNMKDFKGGIGSIDAYQNQDSSVARFVLQMRPGAQEPILQSEGNTLLVATNDTALSGALTSKMNQQLSENLNDVPVASDETFVKPVKGDDQVDTSQPLNILTNLSLEDFLADNTKFYGRQISCTFDNVDTQRALEFIMLDSGVNLILDDIDKVGNVNIRLREVPWDQCLVLIMKTKKLGYSRLGSVLRIAKLSDIQAEERDAVVRNLTRMTVEPMKVRIFPVSYAKASDLGPQVAPFLTKNRGVVSSDARTNSLIVTDIEDMLTKVEKIIKNLDAPPPQVMIEGKIVEAADSFQKSIGINWGFTGQSRQISTNSVGTPVNIQPSFNFGSTGGVGGSTGFGLSVGTLDILGDLNASLSLFEIEGKVKVLSSPRVVTMSNVPATISQTTTPARLTITATQSGTVSSYGRGDPASVNLTVTPQVTNDSTIQMQVSVQRAFYGTPVDPRAPDSAPQFSRNANTTVIVKNGQTSVIGGIFQDDTSEGESGITGLKDIPFFGALFRSRTLKRDKNELLIFITPRIVDNGIGPSEMTKQTFKE
jgi:type IV pilus assembly protein PilQ